MPLLLAVWVPLTLVPSAAAEAVVADVGLGTAGQYSVLAATTITNTGPSVLSGSAGVSPESAVTGFPPGLVLAPGTINAANPPAAQAQADALTAYDDADLRVPPEVLPDNDLVGVTVLPGLYTAAGPLSLNGTVTLNAQGNLAAVFIFQSSSSLIVGSGSQVLLTGGAQACHVYWQVDESATIGTDTAFAGTILALTSISLDTGATLQGRALALNGAVTLDSNVITNGACIDAPPTSTPPTSTPAPTTSTTPPTSTTPTTRSTPTTAPTATTPPTTTSRSAAPSAPRPSAPGIGTTTQTGTTSTSGTVTGGTATSDTMTSATATSGTVTGGTMTLTSSTAGTTTTSDGAGGGFPGTYGLGIVTEQIPNKPVGGVSTGGGATAPDSGAPYAVLGAAALLGAAMLTIAGFRRSRRG